MARDNTKTDRRLKGPTVDMIEKLQAAQDAIHNTTIGDWRAYRIKTQNMHAERLSMFLPEGMELQINRIWHAEALHFHRAQMASRIIHRGYWWKLSQAGSKEFIRLFAAPGSIVTMGSNDLHLVEQCPEDRPSLSVCLFAAQYPDLPGMEPLNKVEAATLLAAAKTCLSK